MASRSVKPIVGPVSESTDHPLYPDIFEQRVVMLSPETAKIGTNAINLGLKPYLSRVLENIVTVTPQYSGHLFYSAHKCAFRPLIVIDFNHQDKAIDFQLTDC
jgi:hypothetical protein